MPLSHENEVLFIHIPKNGGKSFEIFLDIHHQYNGSPNNRSFLNKVSKFLLNITSNKNAKHQLMGVLDKSFAAQHLTYQEILLGNWIDHDILNRYLKVAIIRNPYDRAFSLFNHWSRDENNSKETVERNFFNFLDRIEENRRSADHNMASHFKQQVDFLKDLNGNIVDIELIKLEDIDSEVKKFTQKHQLKNLINKDFPKNKESNNNLRSISKSERNIQKVKELFFDDIQHLGYTLN